MFHFEKVSKKQFLDCLNFIHQPDQELLDRIYEEIKIPTRSTTGSVGYDFYAPYGFMLREGDNTIIPTGIRAVDMPKNLGLFLVPRSGQGFKYRLALANTVGVIDPDYADSSNEGHIMVKISFDGICPPNHFISLNDDLFITSSSGSLISEKNDALIVSKGDKFCQGIFSYCAFISDEDEVTEMRDGGFGSTDHHKEIIREVK